VFVQVARVVGVNLPFCCCVCLPSRFCAFAGFHSTAPSSQSVAAKNRQDASSCSDRWASWTASPWRPPSPAQSLVKSKKRCCSMSWFARQDDTWLALAPHNWPCSLFVTFAQQRTSFQHWRLSTDRTKTLRIGSGIFACLSRPCLEIAHYSWNDAGSGAEGWFKITFKMNTSTVTNLTLWNLSHRSGDFCPDKLGNERLAGENMRVENNFC